MEGRGSEREREREREGERDRITFIACYVAWASGEVTLVLHTPPPAPQVQVGLKPEGRERRGGREPGRISEPAA